MTIPTIAPVLLPFDAGLESVAGLESPAGAVLEGAVFVGVSGTATEARRGSNPRRFPAALLALSSCTVTVVLSLVCGRDDVGGSERDGDDEHHGGDGCAFHR